MKRTRKHRLDLLYCTVICLSLAACGQRGPLFLPDQNNAPEAQGEVAPATEAAGQDGEKGDDDESGL